MPKRAGDVLITITCLSQFLFPDFHTAALHVKMLEVLLPASMAWYTIGASFPPV
jgi:hypothetical protein